MLAGFRREPTPLRSVRPRPGWGGRAKIENSSWPHPRKFGLKRFLVVKEGPGGKWGGLFLGYLLGKNIGGEIALISFRLTWDGCRALRATPSCKRLRRSGRQLSWGLGPAASIGLGAGV
jgi:hypothetical protein